LFSSGKAEASDGGSVAEGIGLGRSTCIVEDLKINHPYIIPDEEALPVLFDLAEQEGLLLGGSSGINVTGAIRLGKEMGPGHTIVTVLCDHGSRYQSKLYNLDFLKDKGLPLPGWLVREEPDIPDVTQ